MYRVLYRKWRPQTFEEVAGQAHITATLKNELISNRVAHAYLFTGSRGTGKTTCSKILAKAVNCLHPVDGNPCNECEICTGIDSGAILDVVEIDAASNNGVENIRELRDEANFTPVKAKYRVYIVDEVHMLSIGAFNALLKILEEPPEHVIFILATTEVHKIPATILSRCQRFDFKRISPEAICERLSYVAEHENLTLDDEAANLIAKVADGALRDALSLLDRCCAVTDNITAEVVTKSAGLAGKEYLKELSLAIIQKDCSKALDIINTLHTDSCDMERLCSEFMLHLRDLLICKTVKNPADVLVCTQDEYINMKNLCDKFTLEELLYCLDVSQDTLADIKKVTNKRISLEMAFVRMCSPQLDTGTDALLRRISALEAKLASGSFSEPNIIPSIKHENKSQYNNTVEPQTQEDNSSPKADDGFYEPEPQRNIDFTPAPIEPKDETVNTSKQLDTTPEPYFEPAPQHQNNQIDSSDAAYAVEAQFTQWPEVINELKKTDMPLVGILNGADAFVRDSHILINSPNPAFGQFIKTPPHPTYLSNAITAVTGKKYKLGIYKGQSTQSSKDPLEGLMKKINDFKNS